MSAPTEGTPKPTPPKRSRRRRLSEAVIRARRRAWRRGLLAWAVGFVLLAAMVLFLSGGAAWYHKLGVWVLLTLLADEAGGWFGYSGALLGAVPFLAPLLLPGAASAPAQWTVAYPLVLAALIACLLVKHAGGPLLAPLALAVFVAPLYLAKHYGGTLDTTVTLPANDAFWRFAFGPALLGLVIGVALAVARRLLRGSPRVPATS